MPKLTDTNDRKLEEDLRAGLSSYVKSQSSRLVGLEQRVLDELAARRRPGGAVKRGLVPSRRLVPVAVALALVIFAGGLLAGLQLGQLQPTLAGGGGLLFVMAYPEAKSVAIAGDFTNWNKVPLQRGPDGIWSVRLQLPPGRYEYAFIVNGTRWLPDPRASQIVRSYGNDFNSVIYVGKRGETL